MQGREGVVAVVDGTTESVFVWWANVGLKPAPSMGRLCGAWVVDSGDDKTLESLTFNRIVLATKAGTLALKNAGLSPDRLLDANATLAAATASRDRCQEAFEIEQARRVPSKRLRAPAQQTLFINLVLQKASQNPNLKFAMVYTNNVAYRAENVTLINLPNSSQLSETISKSKKIICRSGYSTIMDLYELQINFRNVIFVPTPSQTEQEYLANYLMNKFGSVVISQKLFSQKKLQ